MSNVDINVDRRTDGRTDGRKIGRLYRTLLQAGAITSRCDKNGEAEIRQEIHRMTVATAGGVQERS